MPVSQIPSLTFYSTCFIVSPSVFLMHNKASCRHHTFPPKHFNMQTIIVHHHIFTVLFFLLKFAYRKIHKSKVDHSLSLEKCIHCATQTSVNIQNITITPESSLLFLSIQFLLPPYPRSNHSSGFFHLDSFQLFQNFIEMESHSMFSNY